MTWIEFDPGNSDIKASAQVGGDRREVVFPHAFAVLSESQWEKLEIRADRLRSSIDEGYMRVNGVPVAIGERAYAHLPSFEPAQFNERYRREYMQVLAGAALARLLKKGGEIELFALHPPSALRYLDDLMASLGGHYHVEVGSHAYSFHVGYVTTTDEPHAGFMNAYLSADGLHAQRPGLTGARCLAVDVGGGTTDFIRIEGDGQVDPGIAASVPVGINQILRALEQGLYSAYPEQLRHAPSLHRGDLAAAIRTGSFPAAGEDLPCGDLVAQAVNILLGQLRPAYFNIGGGPVPYRAIILTGGGAAMLRDALAEMLEHRNIILAEDDPDMLRYANVRGAAKLRRLYEARGVL